MIEGNLTLLAEGYKASIERLQDLNYEQRRSFSGRFIDDVAESICEPVDDGIRRGWSYPELARGITSITDLTREAVKFDYDRKRESINEWDQAADGDNRVSTGGDHSNQEWEGNGMSF